MSKCVNCNQKLLDCVCMMVDDFFHNIEHLRHDVYKYNASPTPPKPVKRCLACFFEKCQCKSGLNKKLGVA